MNILISGASGLIGLELKQYFQRNGHTVLVLRRNPGIMENQFYWNPEKGIIQIDNTTKIDVVINLAGESLDQGRWTKNKKEQIIDSRVNSTKLLVRKLLELEIKPKLVLSASAVGYYGNNDMADENTSKGSGFLSDVCDKWEQATESLKSHDMRTVNLRFGVVLSPKGGMLKKILPIFKSGLGGKLGSGRQYLSWIHILDVCTIFDFIIQNENISGPVNLVSPNSLTNRDFTRIMGRVVHRSTFFNVPTFVLKLIYGEMAKEMILSSSRILPKKLLDNQYEFKFPDIEQALRDLIERK